MKLLPKLEDYGKNVSFDPRRQLQVNGFITGCEFTFGWCRWQLRANGAHHRLKNYVYYPKELTHFDETLVQSLLYHGWCALRLEAQLRQEEWDV